MGAQLFSKVAARHIGVPNIYILYEGNDQSYYEYSHLFVLIIQKKIWRKTYTAEGIDYLIH